MFESAGFSFGEISGQGVRAGEQTTGFDIQTAGMAKVLSRTGKGIYLMGKR